MRLRVLVRREEPSGQLVVELQKMGARMMICRAGKDCPHVAREAAKELAEFLGIKLVDTSEEPKGA